MENYTKGESQKVFDPPALTREGCVEMKVTGGSKVNNLMTFAMKSIKDPDVKHMTWNGTGNAIGKTITCAEIMKKKHKGLHQITQIGHLKVEDFWEPKVEGLETLKVSTNIPAISILLSKEASPDDLEHPSYQAPGAAPGIWVGPPAGNHRYPVSKKRPHETNIKKAISKPKFTKQEVRAFRNKKKPKPKPPTC